MVAQIDSVFENYIKEGSQSKPAVLSMPETTPAVLNELFQQAADNVDPAKSDAISLTTLKKFGHPRRNQHIKYAHFKTEHWEDFQTRLTRLQRANKQHRVAIEFNGFVRNLDQLILSSDPRRLKEQEDTILINLKEYGAQSGKRGAGEAIHADGVLSIAFPRIHQDHLGHADIVLYYLEWDEPDHLKSQTLHQFSEADLEEKYTDYLSFVNNDREPG